MSPKADFSSIRLGKVEDQIIKARADVDACRPRGGFSSAHRRARKNPGGNGGWKKKSKRKRKGDRVNGRSPLRGGERGGEEKVNGDVNDSRPAVFCFGVARLAAFDRYLLLTPNIYMHLSTFTDRSSAANLCQRPGNASAGQAPKSPQPHEEDSPCRWS